MCDCSPSLARGLKIAWVHSLPSLGIKNCVVALHPSNGDKNCVVALLPSLGIKNMCGCTPSLTDLTRYSCKELWKPMRRNKMEASNLET